MLAGIWELSYTISAILCHKNNVSVCAVISDKGSAFFLWTPTGIIEKDKSMQMKCYQDWKSSIPVVFLGVVCSYGSFSSTCTGSGLSITQQYKTSTSHLIQQAALHGEFRPWTRFTIYCQTCDKRHTKYQNLNVSRLIMQLSLAKPLKPGVQSRTKM